MAAVTAIPATEHGVVAAVGISSITISIGDVRRVHHHTVGLGGIKARVSVDTTRVVATDAGRQTAVAAVPGTSVGVVGVINVTAAVAQKGGGCDPAGAVRLGL